MTRTGDRVEEIARGLREEGLDAELREDGLIHVGPRDRGEGARRAIVGIRDADLDEYFRELSRRDDRVELAMGRLVLLLLEDLTTLHGGGDTNLTTEIRLERGRGERLGLVERRSECAPPAPLGDGTYAWTAERPDA